MVYPFGVKLLKIAEDLQLPYDRRRNDVSRIARDARFASLKIIFEKITSLKFFSREDREDCSIAACPASFASSHGVFPPQKEDV